MMMMMMTMMMMMWGLMSSYDGLTDQGHTVKGLSLCASFVRVSAGAVEDLLSLFFIFVCVCVCVCVGGWGGGGVSTRTLCVTLRKSSCVMFYRN